MLCGEPTESFLFPPFRSGEIGLFTWSSDVLAKQSNKASRRFLQMKVLSNDIKRLEQKSRNVLKPASAGIENMKEEEPRN